MFKYQLHIKPKEIINDHWKVKNIDWQSKGHRFDSDILH